MLVSVCRSGSLHDVMGIVGGKLHRAMPMQRFKLTLLVSIGFDRSNQQNQTGDAKLQADEGRNDFSKQRAPYPKLRFWFEERI